MCLQSVSKSRSISQLAVRGRPHVFPFTALSEMHTPRRAVSSACSSVNYSPLSAAQASSRAIVFGSVCIRNTSSVLHYLPAVSRRSMLHRQAPNPKNAIGCEEYIDMWREGVHDFLTQIVVIFLERPSADLPSPRISIATRSCLHIPHSCFHAYSMRSSWPYHNFPTYPR
jgi:hypothetical protein